MKQQAFVNSKSVAASVSYLMELGADIYVDISGYWSLLLYYIAVLIIAS